MGVGTATIDVRCTVTDGAKHAKLRIEVDDKLDMQRWAIVPAS